MPEVLKYSGHRVRVGGKSMVVPSLSIAQFQEHYDELSKPATADTKEEVIRRFTTMVPILGMAIRRNYPDITDEWLKEELDLISFPETLRAVQNASGMELVPGE